jgi:hypothetical protein
MIYTMSQPYFPPSTSLFEIIKDKFFEAVKEELACYLPDLDVSNVYSRTYGNIKRTPIMIKIEAHVPDGCVEAVEDQLEEVIDNVLNDAYAIEAEKHQVEVQNQITGISRQEEVNEIVELSRQHFIEKIIDEVTSEKQRKWACAQTGDSREDFKGEPSLSSKEAEEMCSAEIEEAEELEELDYQKDVIGKQVKSGKYKKMKKRLIGQGGTENTAPYVKKPSYERSKQAPAGFSALEENDR